MQVVVDGWGRVIKEAEQMDYLKKLEFIPFRVCPAPNRMRLGATLESQVETMRY